MKYDFRCVSYNQNYLLEWNKFISKSKNGTFLLDRNFLGYHRDRFIDSSVLVLDSKDNVCAAFPASIHDNEIRSHGGLTYGGLITDRSMTVPKMLEIFDTLRFFLKDHGINSVVYKCVPRIYHTYFSDEDLYALTKNGAKLIRRDVSTAINLQDRIPLSELRRRGVKKAKKNNLVVKESQDYDTFVNMLAQVLERHMVKPVHTASELHLLASRFPENIKLYCAFENEKMHAGTLVFDTPQCVHTQYLANSLEGQSMGALDLVIDWLITEYASKRRYLDFGISTEQNGMYLNDGLIMQKEMFGGRAIVYDTYRWDI